MSDVALPPPSYGELPEMLRVTQPDYWANEGGGEFPRVRRPSIAATLAWSGTVGHFVGMEFSKLLMNGGGKHAFRVFQEGEEFNADEWDHGTVVYSTTEMLEPAARHPKPPTKEQTERFDEELRAMAIEGAQYRGWGAEVHSRVGGQNLRYRRDGELGVVFQAGRNRRHRYFQTGTGGVPQPNLDQIGIPVIDQVSVPMNHDLGRWTIGQTVRAGNRQQRVIGTTVLHCGEGIKERTNIFLPGFAGQGS